MLMKRTSDVRSSDYVHVLKARRSVDFESSSQEDCKAKLARSTSSSACLTLPVGPSLRTFQDSLAAQSIPGKPGVYLRQARVNGRVGKSHRTT